MLAGDYALPSLMQFSSSVATVAVHEGYGLLVAETCTAGGRVVVADNPSSRWLSRQGMCRAGQVVVGLENTTSVAASSRWQPGESKERNANTGTLSIGTKAIESLAQDLARSSTSDAASDIQHKDDCWSLQGRALAHALQEAARRYG